MPSGWTRAGHKGECDWLEGAAAPQGYAPATINSMLAALNNLFRFLGWNECHMKFLKIQRKLFPGHGAGS